MIVQPTTAESAPVQHPLTNASLKRIAWAYGCAKKGSDEEAMLYERLVERLRAEDAERRTS